MDFPSTFWRTLRYATSAFASPSWNSGNIVPAVWRDCLNLSSYIDIQSNNVLHPTERKVLLWSKSKTFEAPSSVDACQNVISIRLIWKPLVGLQVCNCLQCSLTNVLNNFKNATSVWKLLWSSPAKFTNVHKTSFPDNSSGSFCSMKKRIKI